MNEITFKDFKQKARVEHYGRRNSGLNKVYYDYVSPHGYKYVVSLADSTKQSALLYAYGVIRQYQKTGVNPDPFALKIFSDRKKISLTW